MMPQNSVHSFHIPVMGLSYTVDSPIRVAQYGISSVISIVDDELLEKMNDFYSSRFKLPFNEISQKVRDYRAMRITSYLNLVDQIVKRKFESFKTELSDNLQVLKQFLAMLPDTSELKKKLEEFAAAPTAKDEIKLFIDEHLRPGAIDVNIMTKVDKDNFIKDEKLPIEFNDAHAALRGFANSELRSSIVLSAGMNPRLFGYFEQFPDFFPDSNGNFNKRIIIKVSDFRSAMIQGNYLAKKGLWVSEYRIESGLNCGGHAFASEGFLLGPILDEFMQNKDRLYASAYELMAKALVLKGLHVPESLPKIRITVQGGVGTASEHNFLLSHYNVDSVGWGSPFLLVPEATSMDHQTRTLLANAKESDFYLSNMSPLGVPFNTVKGTTNEFFHQKRIHEQKPGSSCPKKLLALNIGEDGKAICTASRKYQELKLSQLDEAQMGDVQYRIKVREITEKACLCVGLANASYIENGIPIKGQQQGVVVCPGPNLAYFDKEVSLSAMVRHIYGNGSVLSNTARPHMFVKELKLYIDYLRKEINETAEPLPAQQKKWVAFKNNLNNGIQYYKALLQRTKFGESEPETIIEQFSAMESELPEIQSFQL